MVDRLTTLYRLQLIDEQLDELEELRGDLPLAVNELNGKIQLILDEKNAKDSEKAESLEKRKSNEEEIEKLKDNLTKFKAQLFHVRNNKEYDALTKEIDHSEAEIERLGIENKDLEDLSERLRIAIEDLEPQLEALEEGKKIKEEELKKIISGNEKEEVVLREKRDTVAAEVRKNIYNNYMRIRKALGGKAVATITRAACSGCHNIVPSQRQIEIRQNKRLFTCESCGRLLVSAEIAEAAKEKN